MDDQLARIIKGRIRGPLIGSAIIAAVCAYSLAAGDAGPLVIALVAGPGLAMMGTAVLINRHNYPKPRPYYRTYNRISYVVLPTILAAFDLLSAFKSARKAPYGDWAGGSAKDLADAAANAASAGLFLKIAHEGRQVDRLLAARGY